MGCIFEDLVSNSSFISVDSSVADPQLCHSACYSVHGASVSHVGVRWDASKRAMRCACLAPGAFDEDADLGPEAACDEQCEPQGEYYVIPHKGVFHCNRVNDGISTHVFTKR